MTDASPPPHTPTDPPHTPTDDRRAVEHILGRPLAQSWPVGALPPGSRVTVVRDPDRDGPWQVEFLGTIDAMGAPEPNDHAQALSGELLYWVAFDAPQYDSDGQGPYRKAQVWGRCLRPEPDAGRPASPAGRKPLS
ncbi:ferrous iron transport protein A [Streptomyces sp. A0592]|uniref:ferrous iron transport protein A n=1 Tax=Streptomyces sp. A0592 TaxID=2563099 RepID=UPI00109E39E5|nr:ferrous iron transport protein A [Streptomyces sp. A0592]THA84486.1 ferrous iron transport protein A [Streptomyces sp. A0592]